MTALSYCPTYGFEIKKMLGTMSFFPGWGRLLSNLSSVTTVARQETLFCSWEMLVGGRGRQSRHFKPFEEENKFSQGNTKIRKGLRNRLDSQMRNMVFSSKLKIFAEAGHGLHTVLGGGCRHRGASSQRCSEPAPRSSLGSTAAPYPNSVRAQSRMTSITHAFQKE